MFKWLIKLFTPKPKHECKFDGEIKVMKGYRFQKCSHPGCNAYNDLDLDEEINRWDVLIEKAKKTILK